ncbi:MAG: aconitate hydratase AcnA, partial [Waddliaceae bacterium]
MSKLNNPLNTLKSLDDTHYYYSLPALEEQGIATISRLPVSIRVMLESVIRNCDGKTITEEDITRLAQWNPGKLQSGEVPFTVSRVLLQDFTGVPLLVDLAAMRDAIAERGSDPGLIEPQVPVDLVVDHSVQVDCSGTDDAFMCNLKIEFQRNRERYEFLKWGQQAFKTLTIIPPGIGIVHQVNLEHIATVVTVKANEDAFLLHPDTLVGTDSHTTMINGLGVVGWGVGGIEAEAAMLGQPVFLQVPEVIGVHLQGKLKGGITATDLTLRITEMLREENVVGRFVEFFGEGAASLSVPDRATIGNMCPEYGATIGFFPVDEKTLEYLKLTGRAKKHINLVEEYLRAQGLFGIPRQNEVDYTKVLDLDLSTIHSCVSGPKRPQDRIELPALKSKFKELLHSSISAGGYEIPKEAELSKVSIRPGKTFDINESHECGGKADLDHNQDKPAWDESEMVTNRPLTNAIVKPDYTGKEPCDVFLTHGSIVIAAITSCTNTSNPSVMLAAGLLAKKAVERGLKVSPQIKMSLAPGSRVVTDYLEKTGLQKYLDQLGFNLVAYGCTTCIGNSGPLDEEIEKAIRDFGLVTASVLSGNRNFEARIHGAIKANFLMSPPLVVAFALAGKIDIDLENEPIGDDKSNNPVYLRDIWPSSEEVQEAVKQIEPEMFEKRYSSAHIFGDNPVWGEIVAARGMQYSWDPQSTYIQLPPYFKEFTPEVPKEKPLVGMKPLALFGDSVTTDHISPAGAFRKDTPAGIYLLSKGVKEGDFNS